MARFCATTTYTDPAREVAAMRGTLTYHDARCALGTLPNECPTIWAGPYRAAGLVAVGEVALTNRATLITALQHAGGALPTPCDDGTLLLHVYAQFGTAGLAQISGMVALAIWDGQVLTLLRDPVGKRTLFYAHADGCWAAASALRALRRWPPLPAQIDLAAVRSFLTFAYLPGDATLLQGVRELLPGHLLRLYPDGRSERRCYWEPSEPLFNDDPPEVYAQHLRDLLETVTAAMLPSGDPVGVLLSGGVDSSLVTALASRLHDQPVKTYAINFGAALPNELAYSGLVATHCGTDHRVLTVSGHAIAAQLAATVAMLDCPVGDPLTVPNMLLARAVADDGLGVLLNGEGGDPCFGGPKNLPMLIHAMQCAADPAARAHAYLASYRKCYSDLPRLLSPAVQRELVHAPPLEWLVQPYLEAPGMQHYLNRLLLTNVRTKGAHHILTKVERLTAAAGVEGRSPLFAREIVEYAFAVPPQFKLVATNEKWILKQAVRDLLPATIIHRPKSGMRVPVQHWLRGPLRTLAADTLLGPRAQARDLFQPATIRAWMRGEGMVWPRQGMALWLLVTLELWLRAYLDDEG